MIMGPLAAWITKQMDKLWEGKIRPGFEMLVNNFSAGILGMLLAIIGFFVFGPVILGVSTFLGKVVDWLVDAQLLPLLSVVVEPAKVLFLNNAINHGVFTPLGLQQVEETGKSILFLIEANPGPGIGLLLAFSFFGVGAAKASAPGAAIIQFFGGIHEIYFPYAMSKPITIIALIAGGATGVTTNMLLNGGLAFPAAPGSIIAVTAAAVAPACGRIREPAGGLPVGRAGRDRDLPAHSRVPAGLPQARPRGRGRHLRRRDRTDRGEQGQVVAAMDALRTSTASAAPAATDAVPSATAVAAAPIERIVFACDAGMGSSRWAPASCATSSRRPASRT